MQKERRDVWQPPAQGRTHSLLEAFKSPQSGAFFRKLLFPTMKIARLLRNIKPSNVMLCSTKAYLLTTAYFTATQLKLMELTPTYF